MFQSAIGIFLLTTAPFIAGLFTNDPDVLRIGTDCLRILAIGAPAYAIGMIVTQAINGSGDTGTPTVIDFVGFWLVQIPLADLVTDPDGDEVFYRVVGSEHGTAQLSADGSAVLFVPAAGYAGPAQITLDADDGFNALRGIEVDIDISAAATPDQSRRSSKTSQVTA